jgi:redox-sensitive bicupin YhaK (pirin superfamily)
MISVRKANDRGHAQHGWLDSFHTFSFADYHDPNQMGFGALRVINEDRVQAGAGFPTHGHRDMEIISYVLDGAIAHKDSMGTGAVLRPGEVQRMSAGTGVTHSEFNASKTEGLHFLQIWIQPDVRAIAPTYEQKMFGDERKGKLRLVVSPDGRDGSLTIRQDATMYAALLTKGETVEHSLGRGRRAWVQVARGEATLNGTKLAQGDGAAITNETALALTATSDAEVILFDLAP